MINIKTTKGQILNRRDCANFFGISEPVLDKWMQSGCPVKKGSRGVASEYNSAEVAHWLRVKSREEGAGTSQADEAELKRRRLAAETSMAELELAKAKGLVAPLDQVERMVSRAFAEVRANMRNIPGRVVSTLIGELDERIFRRVMLEEIDHALEALTNTDLAEPEDEPEPERKTTG